MKSTELKEHLTSVDPENTSVWLFVVRSSLISEAGTSPKLAFLHNTKASS
jgi:hypothetical protein